ncbi:nicotinate-nucleotide--dimethylbenzimidazole phosphoribosyltransferase [Streptomyces sp. NPDC002306]
MTDTGQIPGEGLPENSGMVEQPGVPAPGAYTYLSETTAEDEDLLLLPGAQSAWGNEVAPPVPEPVVEAVHEPSPHELGGRDSGSVDLSGVRLPGPTPPATPVQPRRPLHLGPQIPDASASPVRSLADRGPAGAPVRQPGPATIGPEYLDVPQPRETPPRGVSPWGAQVVAQPSADPGANPAETVVPVREQQPEPVGAAQAVMARIATEAVAVTAPSEQTDVAFQEGQAGQAVPVAVDQVPPRSQDGGHAHAAALSGPVTAPASAAEPSESAGYGEPVAGHFPVAGPGGDAGQVPERDGLAQAGPSAGPEPVAEAGQVPGPEGAVAGGRIPGPESVEPIEPIEPFEYVEPAAAVADAGQVPGAIPGVEPVPDAVDAVQAPGAAVDGQDADAMASSVTVTAADADQAQDRAQDHAASPAPDAGYTPDVAAPDAGQTPQGVVVMGAGRGPVPPAAPVHDQTPEAVAPVAVAHSPEPVPAPEAEVVTPESPQSFEAPAASRAAEPKAAEYAAPEAPQVREPAAYESAPVPVPGPEAVEPVPAPEAVAFAPLPSALDALQTPHPAHETLAPAEPVPAHPAPVAADAPGEPQPADPSAADLPGAVAPEHRPDRTLGQFVPVDGMVPTTPHLAPTPPHPLVLPVEELRATAPQAVEPPAARPPAPEPVATVPAPRAAGPDAAQLAGDPDPDVVQQAEDLDTRAAEQEDQEEESTAAVEEVRESTGPAAPGYADAEREAVLRVMRERRDIRNGFRGDPIPHEVLLRVLEAAHTAPSVGHSQPWDFVVIRSAETRRTMHELAMRQREAYAKSLPKGRAKQFKELKIEAILDTPVNIVVTADPTRGGRHTLGRHTQPQMAPYSSALAVENLWLAARAEGLGVGWVSFFDEREMVRALGLPDHLEVVAYLCVGYVDEFPDEPELMQAGWSKRRPLSWVVHEETYGRRALPGEDPHDLLAETVAGIRPLDAKALGEAWERQKRMTKPAGALGMLEIISAQLSGLSRQCPPPIPEPAAVAIFAGDHGVHAQGVTPWPQEVTAQMVANFLGGGAVCNAFAAQVGAEVCVVDVGVAADLPATPGLLPRKVRAGTSDMTTGPAMTREEAKQAVEVGIETARDLVAAGNKALLTGEMGIANTTASAALISVFTGVDPAEVTGRGTGINDETLARKTDVVRRALELHQPDPADPIGVLAAIGGFEHAAMVGLLLGGASLRTPVILDGVSAGAAALVARAIAPEVLAACIAGHRSAEPGHVAALNKLGLRPLVDLDLRLGEGTGALLALPLVQSTARAMHEVATFDSAGVTEK